MMRLERGMVAPLRRSKNESSPARLQLEKLSSRKRRPLSLEVIVLAWLKVRQPWISSARTTPTRTRRSPSIRALISRFSADVGWLKNGIQTEVSVMLAPLLFLLRLQFKFHFISKSYASCRRCQGGGPLPSCLFTHGLSTFMSGRGNVRGGAAPDCR